MVERLRGALPVAAVVLFGSRATGDYTQLSDFDLAVVSPAFANEAAMYRRASVLYQALCDLRGVDLVGLAPEELLALDCLLVLDIVGSGVPLHDEGCFAEARARLDTRLADHTIERLPGGWRVLPADPG